MRNKADCDAFEVQAATDMLTDTRRFVEAVGDLL